MERGQDLPRPAGDRRVEAGTVVSSEAHQSGFTLAGRTTATAATGATGRVTATGAGLGTAASIAASMNSASLSIHV